jgi:hypothetical protein
VQEIFDESERRNRDVKLWRQSLQSAALDQQIVAAMPYSMTGLGVSPEAGLHRRCLHTRLGKPDRFARERPAPKPAIRRRRNGTIS